MKRSEEVRIVLDIVRQVLWSRTDWVAQGQMLMAVCRHIERLSPMEGRR